MNESGTQRARSGSPFLPLLLTIAALLLWLAAETWALYGARSELRTVRQQQEEALQQSRQVRGQLQSIMVGTRRLASEGNVNARRILDQLEQRGIRVAAEEP